MQHPVGSVADLATGRRPAWKTAPQGYEIWTVTGRALGSDLAHDRDPQPSNLQACYLLVTKLDTSEAIASQDSCHVPGVVDWTRCIARRRSL